MRRHESQGTSVVAIQDAGLAQRCDRLDRQAMPEAPSSHEAARLVRERDFPTVVGGPFELSGRELLENGDPEIRIGQGASERESSRARADHQDICVRRIDRHVASCSDASRQSLISVSDARSIGPQPPDDGCR
jgi:hypothetical protein